MIYVFIARYFVSFFLWPSSFDLPLVLSFFFLVLDSFYVCHLCICRNVVSYYFCGTPIVGEMRQWEVLLTLRVSIRPVIAPNISAFVNTFANIWQPNREASWNFSIFYIGWRCLIVTVALTNIFLIFFFFLQNIQNNQESSKTWMASYSVLYIQNGTLHASLIHSCLVLYSIFSCCKITCTGFFVCFLGTNTFSHSNKKSFEI